MTLLLEPFESLSRLERELEESFDAPEFELYPADRDAGDYPAINVWEEGNDAIIESELPGLNIEDVNVLVSANEVTLNGERKACQGACANGAFIRRERPRGAFTRVVTLPWDVDATKVSAKLVDGVLTVRMAKLEPTQLKKITVTGE